MLLSQKHAQRSRPQLLINLQRIYGINVCCHKIENLDTGESDALYMTFIFSTLFQSYSPSLFFFLDRIQQYSSENTSNICFLNCLHEFTLRTEDSQKKVTCQSGTRAGEFAPSLLVSFLFNPSISVTKAWGK